MRYYTYPENFLVSQRYLFIRVDVISQWGAPTITVTFNHHAYNNYTDDLRV